jgi:hypothetical protein
LTILAVSLVSISLLLYKRKIIKNWPINALYLQSISIVLVKISLDILLQSEI